VLEAVLDRSRGSARRVGAIAGSTTASKRRQGCDPAILALVQLQDYCSYYFVYFVDFKRKNDFLDFGGNCSDTVTITNRHRQIFF